MTDDEGKIKAVFSDAVRTAADCVDENGTENALRRFGLIG